MDKSFIISDIAIGKRGRGGHNNVKGRCYNKTFTKITSNWELNTESRINHHKAGLINGPKFWLRNYE